jgi:hypothetical protein
MSLALGALATGATATLATHGHVQGGITSNPRSFPMAGHGRDADRPRASLERV